MKVFTFLLAVALSAPGVSAWAQDTRSPDLQQQNHPENNPQPQANQPNAQEPQPSTSRSPDQQQGSSTARHKPGKHKKGHDDARQAHGRPNPSPPTSDK